MPLSKSESFSEDACEKEHVLVDWDMDDFDTRSLLKTDPIEELTTNLEVETTLNRMYYASLYPNRQECVENGQPDNSWPPFSQTTAYDEAVENDTHLVSCRTHYLTLASIDIMAVGPQVQIQQYNGSTVYCLKKLRKIVSTYLLPSLVNTSSRTYIIVLTVHYFKAGPTWWNGNTHYCTVRDCFNGVKDCLVLLDLLIEEE